MPIYEYECSVCGHHHEELQKMNDAPLTECPACHRSCLVKLVSAAGFRLSGSGWYETDFKTGNRRNIATDDNAPAEKSAGETAKSETKAEGAQTGKAPDKQSAPASKQGQSTVGNRD